MDKANRSALILIAEHLKRLNQSTAAAELYRRLGDSAAVLNLHVEAKEWAQAFTLVQSQPQYKALVYVPYAHWLAENDKFVQAQKGMFTINDIQQTNTHLLFYIQHFIKLDNQKKHLKYYNSSLIMP